MITKQRNLEEESPRNDEDRHHHLSVGHRQEDHRQEGLLKEDKPIDVAHHQNADVDHLHLGLLRVWQRKL